MNGDIQTNFSTLCFTWPQNSAEFIRLPEMESASGGTVSKTVPLSLYLEIEMQFILLNGVLKDVLQDYRY
jgi:hypothetical protein